MLEVMRRSRLIGPPAPRQSAEILIDASLLLEARDLGIDLDKVCDTALAAATEQVREERWLVENAEAIASSNAYVEEHGLPLEKYRMF